MNHLKFATLGETWLWLVQKTLETGTPLGDEGLELLGVQVSFPAAVDHTADPLLARFGNPRMIDQMDKVFFGDGPNALGHSYASLKRGPGNRHDLEDVLSLLRAEPDTKRAVVTLCGSGNGKVPCINVIQFLIRDGAVRTFYFARGQDAFQKFYADALCVGKMGQQIGAALGIPAGSVTGFIGSSHIYHHDLEAIRAMLNKAGIQGTAVPTEACA